MQTCNLHFPGGLAALQVPEMNNMLLDVVKAVIQSGCPYKVQLHLSIPSVFSTEKIWGDISIGNDKGSF